MLPILLILAALPQSHGSGHAGMSMPAPNASTKALIAQSNPKDGAMLQGAPATFDVTFVEPTTLTAVTLTDDTDTDVAVTATPAQSTPTTARVALPKLDPGTYRLGWTGTATGKLVSGTLSFMVH